MTKLGRSKKGQKKKELKMSKKKDMLWHEEHPSQKPESNMSRNTLIMPQHAKVDLKIEF